MNRSDVLAVIAEAGSAVQSPRSMVRGGLAADLSEAYAAVAELVSAVRHGQMLRTQSVTAMQVVEARERIDRAMRRMGEA